jgi:hypothetical protein
VLKLLRLLGNGLYDPWGGVTGVETTDASGEIDEGVAVHIMQQRPFGPLDKDSVGGNGEPRGDIALPLLEKY